MNDVSTFMQSYIPDHDHTPYKHTQHKTVKARQKRKQQEDAKKLAAKKAAEEKKARAKQLRHASKAKDAASRSKYDLKDGKVHCTFCNEFIEELEFDDHYVSHPTHIRDRIWLGNAENSKDLSFIKHYGITHILNCTKEIDLPKEVSKKLKSFKRIAIQDKNSETIMDYIHDSNTFIESALGEAAYNVVFVHCREGRSRSVSFLCAYLMWKEKLSFYAALSDIRTKRHIVLPNNKFYSELERFDKILPLNRGKYGALNDSFTLQKPVKDNASKFEWPESSTDDTKMNGYAHSNVEDEKESMVSPSSTASPSRAAKNFRAHGRRRSSSLSSLEWNALLSPSNAGRGRVSINYDSQSNGRKLSPVRGSPVGKKERYKNGWKDVIYDESNIKPSARSKSKGKSSSKKKKKSSSKTKKKKQGDLDVEDAMDVSDIFPDAQTNGDASSSKKKKNKKKKKHKSST